MRNSLETVDRISSIDNLEFNNHTVSSRSSATRVEPGSIFEDLGSSAEMTKFQTKRSTWQNQLSDTVKDLQELCDYLELDITKLELNISPKFPVRAPKYYLDKIAKNNPKDPLLLQILPQAQEKITKPNFCSDPLQEAHYIKAPGLIHKYYNRVLLTLTGACGIHCRYCFRQNFPYDNHLISTVHREQQLDYIKQNSQIDEVILSGGDPLCINNNLLDKIIASLNQISHIKTIRFHTRMPIIIPDRIDQDFINILNKYKNIKFVIVTHCNHPNELDDSIKTKIKLLQQYNITVLNQAVLLKDINNSAEVLIELSQKLFECSILPYYLHLLDPVTGTSHFEVDHTTAISLIKKIKAKLPGYLVPKLVQEVPGEDSKTLIKI